MSDEYVDYRGWMNQQLMWPSASSAADKQVDEYVIEEMSPQHAISAYRKLQRWTLNGSVPTGTMPKWSNLRKSPLARELLAQAVGEEVVYAFELVAEEGRRNAAEERLVKAGEERAGLRKELRMVQDDLGNAQESLLELREEHPLAHALAGTGVTIVINAPKADCCG